MPGGKLRKHFSVQRAPHEREMVCVSMKNGRKGFSLQLFEEVCLCVFVRGKDVYTCVFRRGCNKGLLVDEVFVRA